MGIGCRNIKGWRDANMVCRWVATVLLAAERRFERIGGYQEMPLLIQASEKAVDTKEAVA